jgi:hypothetical protein
MSMDEPQMCTVTDITGGPECPRVARWEWRPDSVSPPVFLCNFHAEPLLPLKAVSTP